MGLALDISGIRSNNGGVPFLGSLGKDIFATGVCPEQTSVDIPSGKKTSNYQSSRGLLGRRKKKQPKRFRINIVRRAFDRLKVAASRNDVCPPFSSSYL